MVVAIHQDNTNFRFRYSIDACDVITSVDKDWVDFAKKNAAPDLNANRVIGQPLWDFIQGEITITLYKALFERVRASSQATLVPYKCDSPTMIRTMVLRITPKENRVLEFKSNIISFEAREHISILDLALPRTEKQQEICSLCRRICFEDGKWVQIERVLMQENFYPKRLPKLCNVICPDCKKLAENLPESNEETT